MLSLEEAEALYEAAKHLRDERRKFERMSDKAFKLTLENSTRKRRGGADVDLNYQAHTVAIWTAQVHAAAVDAGVATLREVEHYEARIFRPSAWHDYPWHPAKPKAFAEREASIASMGGPKQ